MYFGPKEKFDVELKQCNYKRWEEKQNASKSYPFEFIHVKLLLFQHICQIPNYFYCLPTFIMILPDELHRYSMRHSDGKRMQVCGHY